MSPLAILLFCFQACLIQNVMSSCSCGLGAGSFNNAAAINAANNAAAANAAAANIAAANNAAANAAAANIAAANNAAANAAAANIAAANSAAAWNSANAINAAAAISNAAYWPGASGYSAYGSGDVAVVGELPVSGSTSVAGSVPVSGGLTFSGLVPASGLVTISGSCAYPQSYAAASAGAELAVLNSAYSQPSLYAAEIAAANAGRAGLNAALANAELSADLASINSWNSLAAANAASQQWSTIGSGCNKIYY